MSGPPIVLFFVDQLRAEAMGAAGNRFVRTPHLDGLARESVRFEEAVTNAPLCRPARFTLMSGLPVAEHGYPSNTRVPDPLALPSHVRRLRDEAGYRTAVIGKTHLHAGQGHLDDHRDRLAAWGFADAVELPDPQQHHLRSAHSDQLTATTPRGEVDKHRRWRDYSAHYTWDMGLPDAEPWRLSTGDHLDRFCARAAADYVRRYARDEPPYLQVNFPGPHPPFDPTREFVAPLDPDDPALPPALLGPRRGPRSPLEEAYRRVQRARWTGSAARALRVLYYAKVALVDQGVGLVLDALREAGLYEASWIVVTSDHGELLADHGMLGKVLSYEPSIRVPLLIRPPGGVEGWVDRGVAELLDLPATLLEIGGLGGGGLVRRVLEGPGGPLAHRGKSVVFENLGQVGLRTERWTLGWDLERGEPVELFDRLDDPEQRWNRVDEPECRGERDRLVDELRSLRPLEG